MSREGPATLRGRGSERPDDQIGSLAIGLVRVLDLRAAPQMRLQSHLLLPLPNSSQSEPRATPFPGTSWRARAEFCRQT